MVATECGFDCAELGAHAGVDEFVDIICADDELVRAEFDALMAAAWADPPGDEQRLTDPPGRRPGEPTVLAPNSLQAGKSGRQPGLGAWGTPRSPPPKRAGPARHTN